MYNQSQSEINRRLDAVCKRTGTTLIPIHLGLKRGDRYVAYDEKSSPVVPLYKDSEHLSREGSWCVAQFILPYLFPHTEE